MQIDWNKLSDNSKLSRKELISMGYAPGAKQTVIVIEGMVYQIVDRDIRRKKKFTVTIDYPANCSGYWRVVEAVPSSRFTFDTKKLAQEDADKRNADR